MEALNRLEDFVLVGKVEDDYDQSGWDKFHGWTGYVTGSESGDGFDSRDDEKSSADDDDHHKRGHSTGDSDEESEDEESWFYNSRGGKVLESDIPPGSTIFEYGEGCPALPSECTEEEGDEGNDEDKID